MKHSIRLVLWSICIIVFSSCSKKATENFAPTETYHPPKKEMSSTNKIPTTQEGIFWIGSSMNHDFSIDAGSVSFKGVYAINNKENLEKDALGNLQFYPKKSLADLEFFKSEIGNLDYEEGTYYKVEGTKYYLDSKLWAVIVNKVLERVDAQKLGKVEEEVVTMGSTTKTTKRWQNSKTIINPPEPKTIVSSNPPNRVSSIFWISSSKYYPVRDSGDGMSDSDGAYAVLNERVLPRNSSGQVDFHSAQVGNNLTYHPVIGNFNHEEGYYYKVEGTFTYSGSKLMGVSVDKVLQKLVDNEYTKSNEEVIKDFTPTETWHPENDLVDGSNKINKTTKKTTTSSTSTNTTKRTKTNARWQDTKTKKDQSRSSSEVVDINPTETWHPEKNIADGSDKKAKTSKTTRTTMRWRTSKRKIKSTTDPSILDGIFWIGSTRNHSFSMQDGVMSIADAYAINLSHVERKRSGAISRFYPIQNMENFNFFRGKIEKLDYEEGNYYKVEGSLHYEDKKLSRVIVNRVLEKVKDNKYSKEDMKPRSMVSPNPPSVMNGKFWIITDREGSYSSGGGLYQYQDSYLITNNDKLEKNSEGELEVFDGDESALLFYGGELEGFDYEEGMLYQVEGSQHYLGNELTGVQVDKVLRKEKKFTTHLSWNPFETTEKEEGTWAVSKNPPVYIEPEEMIIHIGPGNIRSTLSTGQQVDCLQVQYDNYSRSKDWSSLCKQIRGFEPEVGYQYSLKVMRTTSYNPGTEAKTEEEWYAADDYELISVLKKRWVR